MIMLSMFSVVLVFNILLIFLCAILNKIHFIIISHIIDKSLVAIVTGGASGLGLATV
jgi:hypothetical protein